MSSMRPLKLLLTKTPLIAYHEAIKKTLRIYEFSTMIEKDEAGYYFAYVPSLQGCYTQGKTLEEALKNIKEVIELHLEDRKQTQEIIPRRKPVSITSIEVSV